MSDQRVGRALPIGDACYLAGGAALLASAFLRWVASGEGSGLRGHALVDAVVALGRHVPTLSIGRLTILWYLVPALGAASWITYGITGPRSRVSRTMAVGAAVATVCAVGAFIRLVGVSRLGWGPKVAFLGACALCVGAWAPTRRT